MNVRVLGTCLLVSASAVVSAQDAPIASPEALVLDGIPKLPATLAETAGRYAENRAAFPADWNPVRSEMLIGTRGVFQFPNSRQASISRPSITGLKRPRTPFGPG